MPSDVDEDVVGLRLTVETGPARPEGCVTTRVPAEGKNLCHLLDISGHHYDLRDETVRACVGCISNEINETVEYTILTKQPDQVVF
ncbi:hypothetical protein [Phyllobacterium sp. P5_D12]